MSEECEHNTTKRKKFNGGNPVYVCDSCDMITGYVHDPEVIKRLIAIDEEYLRYLTEQRERSLGQDLPHD